MVAVAVLVWDVSVPGGGFLFALLAGCGLLALAAAWLVRALAHARARMSGGQERRGSWRDVARFMVCPLALAAVWAAVAADVPLEARWALSRGAFEDVVDEPGAEGAGRLGLYSVDRVEREGSGTTFRVSGAGGMSGEAGFSYLPDGTRSAAVDRGYEPLGGPWYWWATAD